LIYSTSHGLEKRIIEAKRTHSMSRVGRCMENDPMESFWATLTCERYDLKRYETFKALQQAIKSFIITNAIKKN
jgi:transposase InsO family protein